MVRSMCSTVSQNSRSSSESVGMTSSVPATGTRSPGARLRGSRSSSSSGAMASLAAVSQFSEDATL
eukprot:1154558-Heterocapsa_arctica.AAC.1